MFCCLKWVIFSFPEKKTEHHNKQYADIIQRNLMCTYSALIANLQIYLSNFNSYDLSFIILYNFTYFL